MSVPSCVVVTGGTGFLGPFVVRELVRRFPLARLRCFVRPASDLRPLEGSPLEFVQGDLNDTDSVATALQGADTLVNLASLGFGWIDSLFAAVARSSIRRGVFVSTTAILTGLPVKSRAIRERAEQLVRASGLEWTILRPTMIYGTGGDRNIARLIRFLQRFPVIPVVAPGALQQPVHVEDVAFAVAACLAHAETIGRVYNLSGREPLTLESLVRETAKASGRSRLVVRVPFTPVVAAVKLYNALIPSPRLRVEQVLRLREDKSFDHSAARNDFGFSPRSFAEGVRNEVRLIARDDREKRR